MAATAPRTLTANEAACVTGVPLRQVHRIIDTGVLGSAAHAARPPASSIATAW